MSSGSIFMEIDKSEIEDLREDSDHTYSVGTRIIELFIPGCQSLKEKRFAVKSIKDRLRNKFNVSVAEIGFHSLLQRSAIAVSTVSQDRKRLTQTLTKVDQLIERDTRVVVTETFTEIL